ncbi:hypothetical protein PFISCL1PPCAC_25943, partial [Pristionchus fissidentatus]
LLLLLILLLNHCQFLLNLIGISDEIVERVVHVRFGQFRPSCFLGGLMPFLLDRKRYRVDFDVIVGYLFGFLDCFEIYSTFRPFDEQFCRFLDRLTKSIEEPAKRRVSLIIVLACESSLHSHRFQ